MTSFSWDKMPIKHKLYIYIISLTVTTWLVFSFFLQPQKDQLAQLTAQYHTERQQVKIIEDFLQVHPHPEKYIVELDKKILYIDAMLPDHPEISTFLLQVEQLSRECGLQLNYLKPINTTNKEGYREYEIEISVMGSFIQSMNFLNQFENKSRFTNVTTIAMLANKDKLETKLSAKIYSFGVPSAVSTNNKTTDK
ncbi:MAG: Pilus assembly protein PilO [Pelosinus sp.]|jgi:type IV pilus assembly protein PilO|nr:Pilus assembly protein PilO [Pelosinus sp.]